MYKFNAKGIVQDISDVKVCEKSGYAKRQVILQDTNGHEIAPEFSPSRFRLLTEISIGDHVSVSGYLKPNRDRSAHFFKAEEINKE